MRLVPARDSLAIVLVVFVSAFASTVPLEAELLELPDRLAARELSALQAAIEQIHERAARSREAWTEDDLQKKVPERFLALDAKLAKVKDPKTRVKAMAELALLWAELAWVERIEPLVEAIAKDDSDLAARVGTFAASENVFARVVGADPKYARAAVELVEAAHEGYRKVFGFAHVSKLPGKKIRVLIRVDPDVERTRLYFHPSPKWHSELRYEMADEQSLTLQGRQRIVYGFAHELGHMVAMWGEYGKIEDDKHAWAHYTGSLIVESIYDKLGNEPWPTWTVNQRKASGKARLLGQIDGKSPGTESREEILALFTKIGDELGTEIYGRAFEWLESKRRVRRLNRVPYLWLRDLRDALLAVVEKDDREKVATWFAAK